MRAISLAFLGCLLVFPQAAAGDSPDAPKLVREGIARYHAGDFKAAARAFGDADVARPDDPRIQFDLATAHAGEGDFDKAVELLRKSAMARDADLAAGSHYNLGTIAAGKATALFGDRPQDASPEVRQEGLRLLAGAVAHYRDCLELDENHADARHNLELIRLWVKHMQALWQQQDRQKQRDEMNLLEFLAMIEGRQRALRQTGKSLQPQPESPKRRQTVTETETSQRELTEEIEPLKEKIAATAAGQPGGTAAPAAPHPQPVNEAVELLSGLADEAGSAMHAAADELAGQDVAGAVTSQTTAVDRLDQVYLGVVPFADLVGRAIQEQQALIDRVAPAADDPDEEPPAELDEAAWGQEAAWDQEFVARWTEVLPAKATQGLEQLETAPPPAAPVSPGSSPGGGSPQNAPDPQALQEQQDALKRSMEKALELGPKVLELTTEAAVKLREPNAVEALPKQEEALELLKQIAEELPKQDQQQPQQGDQQQDQEQPQQDDQEQPGEDQQEEQPPEEPEDLSKQQAEAVLRKARQRQRERRELERELQQYLYRPGAVQKDW